MVGGFLRAFKSETRRVLLSQRPDLDLSKLEEMTPSHLAKVAKDEEDTKKAASEQRKKKKHVQEKPPSMPSTTPNLTPEGSTAEATADTIVLDESVAGSDVIAPESGAKV